jgi:hypothetical protein
MSLVFQPAFRLKGSLERHAGAGFRRRGFLGLPQGLLRQFPVRFFPVNRTQVEQKGDCGVAVGNALSAEIRFDLKVSECHSRIVRRRPSFVERAAA